MAVEYDHFFMGNRAITSTSACVLAGIPAGSVFRTDSIRQDVDMVTARINYCFNWAGGPLVAKYPASSGAFAALAELSIARMSRGDFKTALLS